MSIAGLSWAAASDTTPIRRKASVLMHPSFPFPGRVKHPMCNHLLLGLHARFVHHAAPHLDFPADGREKLLGRAARGRDAVVLELLTGLLELQHPRDLRVQPLDHGARHPLRPDEAVPEN